MKSQIDEIIARTNNLKREYGSQQHGFKPENKQRLIDRIKSIKSSCERLLKELEA